MMIPGDVELIVGAEFACCREYLAERLILDEGRYHDDVASAAHLKGSAVIADRFRNPVRQHERAAAVANDGSGQKAIGHYHVIEALLQPTGHASHQRMGI